MAGFASHTRQLWGGRGYVPHGASETGADRRHIRRTDAR